VPQSLHIVPIETAIGRKISCHHQDWAPTVAPHAELSSPATRLSKGISAGGVVWPHTFGGDIISWKGKHDETLPGKAGKL